ncbi:hypothetical protein [Helicobacter ailurogastricus]|uniref:hypothetical protein n=1 Tax=Helicobacter ailurogastricus TaxID=1578720 RepID=UPI00249163F8|nr:hypothetical protein [Helicobacter ailurogastricus]
MPKSNFENTEQGLKASHRLLARKRRMAGSFNDFWQIESLRVLQSLFVAFSLVVSLFFGVSRGI